MARTFNDKTWYPTGWLDVKTVKPKLGDKVLITRQLESGELEQWVAIYAINEMDHRRRGFFMLHSDIFFRGRNAYSYGFAYSRVLAWMYIPPYKP